MTRKKAEVAISMALGASVFLTMGALLVPWVGLFQVMIDQSVTWVLVEFAVLVVLTWGFFKRSRICAVVLLVLFVAAYSYAFWTAEGAIHVLAILPLAVAVVLLRGVDGVFEHHRLCDERDEAGTDDVS